ncbi:PH domain-containing protein [Catellatospora sichuanensis]|uniref:PH domain-containing protein n=1 Tax=Catellatospora sichuanensis TaxID=1969805 RepID=UPI00164339C4|nr:PH domain-containing protein [Catellatospora sichuanensis]
MAFPDELLVGSEEVVERFSPSWVDYIVAELLRFVGYSSAVCVLWAVVSSQWLTDPFLTGAVVILLLVIGFALVVSAAVRALRCTTTRYAITDQRLLVREGILSRHDRTVPLNMIRGIDVHQDLLDRMVGKGSLRVNTAVLQDQGVTVLRDVHRPRDLQRRLRELAQGAA